MRKIGPRIFDGKYFELGSQCRFEILEGSDEQYFLRGRIKSNLGSGEK